MGLGEALSRFHSRKWALRGQRQGPWRPWQVPTERALVVRGLEAGGAMGEEGHGCPVWSQRWAQEHGWKCPEL